MGSIQAPTAEDKSELCGRIYEAVDIVSAIEQGYVKTMDDLLVMLKQRSENFSKVMECGKWVHDDNSCLDCSATLELDTKSRLD